MFTGTIFVGNKRIKNSVRLFCKYLTATLINRNLFIKSPTRYYTNTVCSVTDKCFFGVHKNMFVIPDKRNIAQTK